MQSLYICILLTLSYMNIQASSAFNTLHDIVQYVHKIPEFPPNESLDPYHPQYDTFHVAGKQTYFDKMISVFGFKKSLNVNALAQELYELSIARELQGYIGNFVRKFHIDTQTRWFIWGSLHGALHSLVRALQELEEKKVINDDLRITNAGTYLVFNGNVTSYSPFNLEVLHIIAKLMQQNPKKVFLTKGHYEQKAIWKEYTLKHELNIRFPKQAASLESLIDRFFNTLPLALYLVGSEENIVRISSYSEHPLLQEARWKYFFENQMINIAKIDQITPSDEQVTINAQIQSPKIRETPHKIHPLKYEKKGVTFVWSIFSSPIGLFKSSFDFKDDVFVRLQTGKFFSNWKLTLFSQSQKNKNGFEPIQEFNIETGQKLFSADKQNWIAYFNQQIELAQLEEERLQKVCAMKKEKPTSIKKDTTDKKIVTESKEIALQDGILSVGTFFDLSKSLQHMSDSYKEGLEIPIEQANKKGGVHGIKIRLIILDNQYNPSLTRKQVDQLITEDITNVILGALGTPTLASYLDLIKEKKILSVFPLTGSYGELQLPYLLKLRASNLDIGYMLTDQVLKSSNIKRFAFFYQNDQFGKDLLEGAQKALEKAGIEDFIAVPYEPHQPALTKQAREIEHYNPDAIGLFSVTFATKHLLNSMGPYFLRDKVIFANELLDKKTFQDFIHTKGLTFIQAQVVPDPDTSNLPIVEEYRKAALLKGYPFSSAGLEGYITSAVFLEILSQLKDRFTIESFIQQTESLKNFDFKGLTLNFNEKTRQLLNTLWLDTGNTWIPKPIIMDE